MSLEKEPLLITTNPGMNSKSDKVGISFVKYHNHVKVHEKEERYDTLSKEVLRIFLDLQTEMAKQSEVLQGNKKSGSEELLDLIINGMDHLKVIIKHHEDIMKLIEVYCKANEEEVFTTISSFCPKFRGLFLSICHFFGEYFENCKKNSKKSIGKRTGVFTPIVSMLEKFAVIYELCNKLEALYVDIHGDKKVDFYCTGYDHKVDMSRVNLDYTQFYEKIGKQYTKESRFFHNSYLSFLAGYSKICNNDTIRKTLLLRDLGFSTVGLYYALNHKARAKAVVDFGKIEEFKKSGCFFWDIQDDKIVAPFFDFFVLQGVYFSKVFALRVKKLEYNPKNIILEKMGKETTPPEVVEVEIEEEIEEPPTKKQQIVIHIDEKEEDELNDIKVESKSKTKTPENLTKQEKLFKHRRKEGGTSLESFLKYYKELCDYYPINAAVDIRLILPNPVPDEKFSVKIKNGSKEDMPIMNFFKKIFTCKKSKCCFPGGMETNTKAVMIHFHGGGFISMSSHSHETYTRRWAKGLNIPIFSIDYTNAPDKRFPFQLLQCYQAYKYIVNYSKKIFGTTLEKVFIAGDSAGGNLTAAVTLLAIVEKERVPDAIVMSYPTGITAYEPCPSRVCGLIDPLVSKPFLELVLNHYPDETYHDVKKSSNSFLSPLTIPDELWSEFPHAYVSACCLDPLFDDGVTIAKKLDKHNKGKVRLNILEGVPHGFLNFCDLIPQAMDEIKNIQNWLKNFL